MKPDLPHLPAKALSVRNLTKSYRMGKMAPVAAVEDFNLELAPGEFVTLLGPSGCGKTTVLRTVAGLEDFDRGDILLDDQSIARMPSHRRHMGLVFQNYALFPHMSVFENVAYPLRIRKAKNDDIAREVAIALQAVGLSNLGPRLPGQLSGGQQQRVAVARVLVMKPDLLLFDEPLSNLDAKLRVEVRSELRRLQKALGTTTLYVTHDQDEAMSLSDRIAVMRAGKVEQVGTPEEIYARPASLFVAEFVGQVNVLPGRVTSDTAIEVFRRTIRLTARAIPAKNVHVLVRPEAIRVHPPSDNMFSGRIEEIEYLGGHIACKIKIGSETIMAIVSSLGRSVPLKESDTVGVDFPEDAIHLLPADNVRALREKP
jgi:iron(III) transport system ATP-binding protein